jgi:hypothetical protein
MISPANVVKAIERFDSWATPWQFITDVSSALASNPGDGQLLEQIWVAAGDREIWLSADTLASGAAAVEAVLLERFPWLSPLACQQLVRGAAYQWR